MQHPTLQPIKDLGKAWNVDVSAELDNFMDVLVGCDMR